MRGSADRRTSCAQRVRFACSGVEIGVIDSAINPDLAVFQGADLTVHEPAFCGGPAATTTATTDSVHGSDVTALLVGNGTGPGAVRGAAPGAAVTFYGIDAGSEAGSSSSCNTEIGGRTYSAIGRAIRQAVADGNRVISISLVSSAQNDGDIHAVTQALARGIVIVAGGENSTIETTSPFPHRANGVVSVNAIKEDGSLQTQGGGGVAAFRSTTVVAGGWGFSSQAAVKPAIAWGDNAVRIAGSSLARITSCCGRTTATATEPRR
ncbi:S8 family serine peptidase [Schumannella soli]|uniref:Peptidase S8/S53 domain-containing protein n=1 Tax=Schumannella soli TaxID=2590779 RepID=A0A506Y739_9MICO|nr:S8 family serine peptidase [Schumannella soli]TPW77835.1 hypothetical protein FJ657_04090 [Schumannella soli]